MFKSLNNLAVRAMVEFIVITSVLSLIGYAAYRTLDKELKSSLEESVALQSQSIAFGIEQQFEEEFKKLQSCSALAMKGKITFDNLIELSLVGTTGESMGILTRTGEVITGSSIPKEEFELFYNVFNGEKEIKYRSQYGLIFAIPITVDGQTCLLYDCFDDEATRRRFGALSYNGEGTLFLINGSSDAEHLMLSTGSDTISIDKETVAGWNLLTDKFDKNNRIFCTSLKSQKNI